MLKLHVYNTYSKALIKADKYWHITNSTLKENENKTPQSLYTNCFNGQMPNEVKSCLEPA